MITQATHKCLIRKNLKIRTILNQRLNTYDITAKEVVKWGKESGCSFTESQLSKYRKHGDVKGGMAASDVLWLCGAFAINLELKVTRKKFEKTK